MDSGKTLKDILDWGKRIQFVYQAVTFFFSASVVGAVRAMIHGTSVPVLWRPPIYLLTAGAALLMFASLGRWWSNRNKGKSATGIIEEVMQQGAQAALYDYMSCRAGELIRDLNMLWHHWDNAGEKLIHPLDGTIDKFKNVMADNFHTLINERRDFMVLYGHHLMQMESSFPDFTSQTMAGGFPSGREYRIVYSDLVEHEKELARLTRKTWEKYGKPLDD